MNFGEKVKQLRAERNLTQPQLAQSIGIEQSYLSKLENDKSVPSADIFQSILKALAIDVPTFLEGVDEKIVYRDLRQIPDIANQPGGMRTYSEQRTTAHERPQNRWIMLAGALFTFGGIFGFIVEQRLRRIRLS